MRTHGPRRVLARAGRYVLAALLLYLAWGPAVAAPVRYEPIQPDRNGTYPDPPAASARDGKAAKDAKGVVSYVSRGGHRDYHPFDIATQALGDAGVDGTPNLDMARLVARRKRLARSQLAAFRWLRDNARSLPNGGVAWYYTFPLYYNPFTVLPPWPSAFAQARVIQACVYAYRVTRRHGYLDLALRAARAYALDVADGGLRDKVDGLPFFEEVPLPNGYSPHILNGHLYSVAMLDELAAASGDPAVRKLADEGAATALKLWRVYDAEGWTKYDLVPRLSKLVVCVKGRSAGLKVLDASLLARDGTKSTLVSTAVDGASHVFVTNVPQAYPVRDFLRHPGFVLRIVHEGDIAAVGLQGMRDKLQDFVELDTRPSPAGQGARVAEYAVPLELLANWNLTRTYQRWHARLARKIGEQRGDRAFLALADRWNSFVDGYDKDLKNRRAGTCPMRKMQADSR